VPSLRPLPSGELAPLEKLKMAANYECMAATRRATIQFLIIFGHLTRTGQSSVDSTAQKGTAQRSVMRSNNWSTDCLRGPQEN